MALIRQKWGHFCSVIARYMATVSPLGKPEENVSGRSMRNRSGGVGDVASVATIQEKIFSFITNIFSNLNNSRWRQTHLTSISRFLSSSEFGSFWRFHPCLESRGRCHVWTYRRNDIDERESGNCLRIAVLGSAPGHARTVCPCTRTHPANDMLSSPDDNSIHRRQEKTRWNENC